MNSAPPALTAQGIFITRDELVATRGLSDRATRLYWVLRSLMDYATGIVGKSRRISYQALKEECEVLTPKGKGYQRTQPTEKALRCALAGLERAGLAETIGPLVFRLVRAQTAQARPNRTGREQGAVERAANPCQQGDAVRTGQDETAERGAPLRVKEVPKSTAPVKPVDNFAGAGLAAANFLNLLSKKLGYPIAHNQNDLRLAQWGLEGVSAESLELAAVSAIKARQRDGNRAPLNPGFIGAFLAQATDWRETWSGIVGKGKALGIEQQPGELAPYFKIRVFQRAGVSEAMA
jgi:hypothetical protein